MTGATTRSTSSGASGPAASGSAAVAGRSRWAGALAGVLAAGAALGVGELLAGWFRPSAAPLLTVGQSTIRLTPGPVERWAIETFGTADKPILQLGTALVLLALAAGAGVLALRRRWVSAAAVAVLGAVGVAAALRPEDSSVVDAVPAFVGAVVGLAVFRVLLRMAPVAAVGAAVASQVTPRQEADAEPEPAPPLLDASERRRFLVTALAVAAASSAAAVGGRQLGGGAYDIAEDRAALRLPAPDSPARPVPAAGRLRLSGLSPYRTPNSSFYRIDTALLVPRVDAESWQLRIHGPGVRRELTIGYRDLLARPLLERDITLACVSNPVGGDLVGNARWLGVSLRELLREAGVRPPSAGGRADHLVAHSVDGMTIGSPVEAVMDGRDALLAVGMNGEPLPFRHGYPVRMVVPGLYGYVSACKWLKELELTTFDAYDAYWTQRGWSARAEIKTQSRIDTPRGRVSAGTVRVAGVAWAQHRGIREVEVRVDGGPWHRARLAAAVGTDTWRQWVWEWEAKSGEHALEVRARDGRGVWQTGRQSPVEPDGATGWHRVEVVVG